MKNWAKAHNINSSKDKTLNSLSIILLVAFHLQVYFSAHIFGPVLFLFFPIWHFSFFCTPVWPPIHLYCHEFEFKFEVYSFAFTLSCFFFLLLFFFFFCLLGVQLSQLITYRTRLGLNVFRNLLCFLLQWYLINMF